MTETQETVEIITMPTPFPVGPINLYLLKEDPVTLIDAGPSSDKSLTTLTNALNSHGFSIKDIKRLIITHTHPDHIGLASKIQEISGAEIFLHKNEIAKLSHQSIEEYERVGILAQAGIPPAVIEELAKWNKNTRKSYVTKLDVAKITPLQGGEQFQIGSRTLQVLNTPGHSPGHICLYDATSQELFSGDHILAEISPNPLLELDAEGVGRNKSLVQYLDSLKIITQIPLTKIYPGHGTPFTNYHEVLERFYYHFQQRERTVFQLIGREGKTAYEIAGEMYPEMRDIDIFLAVSRVMGHLDILQEDGKVKEIDAAGISLFSLV